MFPKHLVPTLKKFVPLLIVLGGAAWSVSPARAQIGGSDLPDLSGLAGAIENSTKNAPLVQPQPPAPGTIYHSGMTVPSVHPGEAAKGYVHQLRETFVRGKAPATAVNAMQQLEDGMPKMLSDFEAYMQKNSFAKRDMGVAYGVFFAENWKTATKQTLSDAAEANVVRTYSDYATSKYKAKFAAQSPAQKEKTYETVLSGTMILSEFAQVYDKAGKTEMEASMRKGAKALFTKVVGVDPAAVDISLDGKISGSAPTTTVPPFVDSPNYTGPDPATQTPPVTDTSPLDAPPADKPSGPQGRVSPRGGVKPSQIAGIYCRPAYGSGAGGFPSISYEPVLALKDGTYCGGYNVPPPDLDVAASRRAHPADWGRWRRQGTGIQTLGAKGQWGKSGWIGPLPPSGPGQKLSGRYTKISGGGNSALGGDITIAIQDSFVFSPEGTFQSGHTNSITSSQVAGGASRAGSGTYAISRNAITLRFAGGTVQRWSYAKTADGLVFLHGSAYVDDK